MEAIFKLNGRIAETSKWAGGPWNPEQQHGSAPTALVAWLADEVPTAAPMRIARITMDLLRPVPVAPLEIQTDIVREGRKIQLLSVRLSANGVEVVRANVLKVRALALDLPPSAAIPRFDLTLPKNERLPSPMANKMSPFVSSMQIQEARGVIRDQGPSAAWFKAERPIIEGVATTPAMRAALAADFCNGVSSVLDFAKWTFINGDLTMSLARPPVGEWILLDAESWIGPEGSGIAFGKLADVHGYFGRAVQSLVIEPR